MNATAHAVECTYVDCASRIRIINVYVESFLPLGACRLAKPLSPEAGPVTGTTPIAHARWNFT